VNYHSLHEERHYVNDKYQLSILKNTELQNVIMQLQKLFETSLIEGYYNYSVIECYEVSKYHWKTRSMTTMKIVIGRLNILGLSYTLKNET